MSISRYVKIKVNGDKADLSEKLYLHAFDRGIDLYFSLDYNSYNLNEEVIKNLKDGHIKATVLKPYGEILYYDDLSIYEDKILFTIKENMTDDLNELGDYQIQFHIYDSNQQCRLTIPPITFTILDVLSRNISGTVDNSIVDQTRVAEDPNEIALFSIDEDGYIKTIWNSGDLITSKKLNNLEDGLEYTYNELKLLKENGVSADLSKLQTKSDDSLNTTDKTIVGAINEVKDNVDNHTHSYNALNDKPTIPTNTSELNNDADFATKTYVTDKINEASLSGGEVDLSDYQKISDISLTTTDKTIVGAINEVKDNIPSKTSELENDSNYITSNDIPSIPTKLSELANDKNFINNENIIVINKPDQNIEVREFTSNRIHLVTGNCNFNDEYDWGRVDDENKKVTFNNDLVYFIKENIQGGVDNFGRYEKYDAKFYTMNKIYTINYLYADGIPDHIYSYNFKSLDYATSKDLSNKADIDHTHTINISDITNLQTELDNKASLSHRHDASDIDNLNVSFDTITVIDKSQSYSNIISIDELITNWNNGNKTIFVKGIISLDETEENKVLDLSEGSNIILSGSKSSSINIHFRDAIFKIEKNDDGTYTKFKTNFYLNDSVRYATINDSFVATTRTYSSFKIEELISNSNSVITVIDKPNIENETIELNEIIDINNNDGREKFFFIRGNLNGIGTYPNGAFISVIKDAYYSNIYYLGTGTKIYEIHKLEDGSLAKSYVGSGNAENIARIWDIRTRLSDMENDIGFVTSSAIPTKVSQLENDSNYIAGSITDTISTSSTDEEVPSAKASYTELNKKVNITDIVDNLTSTDTDKPLSANQGKILNDTKLNKTDANKLNCITIDNVSLKEYILTNFTTTEEKTYYLIAKTTCTDLPKDSNFYITVETPGSYTYKVTAKELNDSNGIYVCTYRTISSSWTEWEKVLSSSYYNLISINNSLTNITLTEDKYQSINPTSNITITMPTLSKSNAIKEIHVYYKVSDTVYNINFNDTIRWQKQPTIEANKVIEFIFTNINDGTDSYWLGGSVVYE